ncbi:MAG: potassium/proton antiporter [Alphaproteobacteria bacterium]
MASIGLVNTLLLLGALLVLAGIMSSLIASRFGMPLLLVFLVIGMLAGEDGPGNIQFSDYRLTYLVGSAALAVILFDGGLRTRLASFRGALAPSMVLATVGVVVTAALTGLLAVVLLEFTPLEGALVGAIVASTDAAAVFFLLRTGGLQLRKRVGTTLEIESGTNDPVAMFLTLVLVEVLLADTGGPGWEVAVTLASQAAVGAALGIGGGFAVAAALNRLTLPTGLHPLFVVAAAVSIYAATSLAEGSGFLAVYLAGLVLGNRPVRAFASITSFHDAATWLAQILMFILLGLLVTPTHLLDYAIPGLAIALWLMLVARPLAVWVCLAPFRFAREEKAFVSWVGLRGAVSIFLAAVPMLSGLPHADAYFNIAFFVVLVSLLVQGSTVTSAARRLGIALGRTVPPVARVDLDLPGQLDLEMAGYPVLPDSPVLRRPALPRWARLTLVVRDQVVLGPAEAGALRAGDYAYLLAPPSRLPRLDPLFASAEDAPAAAATGGFTFAGDVTIDSLATLYDFAADLGDDQAGVTIAALFAEQFDGRPVPGDRIDFGTATLIAGSIANGNVAAATLVLEDFADSFIDRVRLVPAAARLGPRTGGIARITAASGRRIAGAVTGTWRKLRGIFAQRTPK